MKKLALIALPLSLVLVGCEKKTDTTMVEPTATDNHDGRAHRDRHDGPRRDGDRHCHSDGDRLDGPDGDRYRHSDGVQHPDVIGEPVAWPKGLRARA